LPCHLPTQISPLFPYTTLFRSEGSAISACRTLHGAQMTYASTYGNGDYAGTVAGTGDVQALVQLGTPALVDSVMATGTKSGYNLDRKSTRLNSSHQIISYAVFC